MGDLQCSQPEVPNLYQSSGPVDEDVVTLEVSVDDGGVAGVEVVQALQDLPAPGTNELDLDILEPTHVSVVWGRGGEGRGGGEVAH